MRLRYRPAAAALFVLAGLATAQPAKPIIVALIQNKTGVLKAYATTQHGNEHRRGAGTALAGLGDVMWAVYQELVTTAISADMTLLMRIVVIVGGPASVSGCLLGAMPVGLTANDTGLLAPRLALGFQHRANGADLAVAATRAVAGGQVAVIRCPAGVARPLLRCHCEALGPKRSPACRADCGTAGGGIASGPRASQ